MRNSGLAMPSIDLFRNLIGKRITTVEVSNISNPATITITLDDHSTLTIEAEADADPERDRWLKLKIETTP